MSEPRKQTTDKQSSMSWYRHDHAVAKPARQLFGYIFAAWFGAFAGVALVILWYTGASLTSLFYSFAICFVIAFAVAGSITSGYFVDWRAEYIDLSQTIKETVQTEYRQQPASTGGSRPITSPHDKPKQMKIGNLVISETQKRRLARSVNRTGNFSQEALADAGIITNRSSPGQATQAKAAQKELIRLGYAYTYGQTTRCSDEGRKWLAPALPHDERMLLLDPIDNDDNDDNRGIA